MQTDLITKVYFNEHLTHSCVGMPQGLQALLSSFKVCLIAYVDWGQGKFLCALDMDLDSAFVLWCSLEPWVKVKVLFQNINFGILLNINIVDWNL